MNWINVSYNSNQNYIVQESAILDVINNSISTIKSVKLANAPRLSFDEKHSNVHIYIDIKIKNSNSNKVQPTNIIKELVGLIEEDVRALIDKKPKNVQVVLLDFY
ncbi:MMB_0454 family protein [Mycoplasma sp. Pen4]|uniref:MMB_0454 family protein n=1 Tax=Mycoplasma sp. Pen4 TaxID=640330 RepID=UPI002104A09A|nr:hypothetical protein [Mycoplasma sp. Pen4]